MFQSRINYRDGGTGGAQGARAPPVFWEEDPPKLWDKAAMVCETRKLLKKLLIKISYVLKVFFSKKPIENPRQL